MSADESYVGQSFEEALRVETVGQQLDDGTWKCLSCDADPFPNDEALYWHRRASHVVVDLDDLRVAFHEAERQLAYAVDAVLDARRALLHAGVPSVHTLPTQLDVLVRQVEVFRSYYGQRAKGALEVARLRRGPASTR